MNTKFLTVILCVIALGTSVFFFPDGVGAVLVGGVCVAVMIVALNMQSEDRDFLLKLFCIGLILRFSLALFINVYGLQIFFGPDALYYDWLGWVLSSYWSGDIPASYPDLIKISQQRQPGWGMYYIVGIIYFLVGQNQLAVQLFCAVIGAATAPITYLCSKEIFSNKRVAQTAGLIVALCPSLIIWSSQGLKDGIIVFFLVLSMVCVLRLQKSFSYASVLVLLFSLFCVLTLRFYIFYMLVVGIIGCFAITEPINPMSVLRRTALLLVLGLTLTSFGATGERDWSSFSLERMNSTREDLARGNAGFNQEADVSTAEGALAALPIGFTYLMLAPFPWQLGNLRQALTLPEMILWWSSMPFLVIGLWYSIKYRLRTSIGVLLFTLMLTVAYSLYQGNIGTAYRQRAQIQIFHFMFIAAGWGVWREKRENQKLQNMHKKHKLHRFLQEKQAAQEYLSRGGNGGGADANLEKYLTLTPPKTTPGSK